MPFIADGGQKIPMFAGRWRNERGSEMVLEQDGNQIKGRYITAIGDDRVIHQDYPLVGMSTGELVGFVVAWPETSSLTSWAGRLVQNTDSVPGGEIHTIWHLARQDVPADPPRPAGVWESFITFASVFKKIPDASISPS